MSVGVRGLRIGTGPRGNYIRAGRGGIYYQASLSPRRPRTHAAVRQPAAPQPSPTAAHSFDPTLGNFEAVDVGSSVTMRETSAQDILNTLNEARQRWRLWPLLLLVSVCTVFAAAQVPMPPWEIALIAVMMATSTWIVYIRDCTRTTAVLLYDLDDQLLGAYTSLNTAFDNASSSNRIWHVQTQARVLDRKYHSGASTMVNTDDTRLQKAQPPRVKINIQPPKIQLGASTLYLLPDQVLFLDAEGFGSISYRSLGCQLQYGSFVIHGVAPPDAQIIEYTWRYVNKNGGPDRRFANNPQFPVIRVADVHLITDTGFAGVLKFSNIAAAQALCTGLQSFTASLPQRHSASSEIPAEPSNEPSSDERRPTPSLLVLTALIISLLTVAYVGFEYLSSPAASSLFQAAENSSASQNLSNPTETPIPFAPASRLTLSRVAAAITPSNQSALPLVSVRPTASPSPLTYRIVNISQRDFLNLRAGPGENYRLLARIRPTARGIIVRSGRAVNGSTKWREISADGYTGWANEVYLEPESLAH